MLVSVYGTLRTGASNHHVMKNAVGVYKGTGILRNVLMVSLGAFPAVCLDAEEDDRLQDIVVEVFEVPEEDMVVLDRYENHYGEGSRNNLYEKSTVTVELEGEEVQTLIYHMEGKKVDFMNYKVVEGGDWFNVDR